MQATHSPLFRASPTYNGAHSSHCCPTVLFLHSRQTSSWSGPWKIMKVFFYYIHNGITRNEQHIDKIEKKMNGVHGKWNGHCLMILLTWQSEWPLHKHWMLQLAPTYPKSHLHLFGSTHRPRTQPCVHFGIHESFSTWMEILVESAFLAADNDSKPSAHSHSYPIKRSIHRSDFESQLWCPLMHSFSGGHFT